MKTKIRVLAAAAGTALLLTGCGRLTVEGVMNVIAPTETPIPGADATFVGEQIETVEPLRLTYQELGGVFCPFWAVTDGDRTVVELTQLSLLAREGQQSPSEILPQSNEDGSTSVTIRLRDGLVFSDETPVTARDLLFTYYVLLDSSYDGPSQLRTLPIRGLSSYWNGMDMDMYSKYIMLYDMTFNQGRYDKDLQEALENARRSARENGVSEEALERDAQVKKAQEALDAYDTERAEEIRSAIEAAWRRDAQAMVDYTMANYSGTIALRTDYTKEDVLANPGLQVMYTMLDRGFGSFTEDGGFAAAGDRRWDLTETFPTAEDLFDVMYAAYNGDPVQYWSIEGYGRGDMLANVENEMVRAWAPEDEYWRGSVDAIEGLEITDSRTVTVTLEYCDESILRILSDVYVAPMHFYGDADMFLPEHDLFGFTRGDLSAVRAHAGESLGAGEYVYRETDVRTVLLDVNPFYWLGQSDVPYVEMTKQ